jgi:hypothetical protein
LSCDLPHLANICYLRLPGFEMSWDSIMDVLIVVDGWCVENEFVCWQVRDDRTLASCDTTVLVYWNLLYVFTSWWNAVVLDINGTNDILDFVLNKNVKLRTGQHTFAGTTTSVSVRSRHGNLRFGCRVAQKSKRWRLMCVAVHGPVSGTRISLTSAIDDWWVWTD